MPKYNLPLSYSINPNGEGDLPIPICPFDSIYVVCVYAIPSNSTVGSCLYHDSHCAWLRLYTPYGLGLFSLPPSMGR